MFNCCATTERGSSPGLGLRGGDLGGGGGMIFGLGGRVAKWAAWERVSIFENIRIIVIMRIKL
jgi:hypothetical protein